MVLYFEDTAVWPGQLGVSPNVYLIFQDEELEIFLRVAAFQKGQCNCNALMVRRGTLVGYLLAQESYRASSEEVE